MKKNEFEIYTKKDFKFIPANVIIIRDKNGWVFISTVDTKWYVNSTNDNANCPPEEVEKYLKVLVKAIKDQLKLVTPDEN